MDRNCIVLCPARASRPCADVIHVVPAAVNHTLRTPAGKVIQESFSPRSFASIDRGHCLFEAVYHDLNLEGAVTIIVVEASIIDVPCSTPNANMAPNTNVHLTRKGNGARSYNYPCRSRLIPEEA